MGASLPHLPPRDIATAQSRLVSLATITCRNTSHAETHAGTRRTRDTRIDARTRILVQKFLATIAFSRPPSPSLHIRLHMGLLVIARHIRSCTRFCTTCLCLSPLLLQRKHSADFVRFSSSRLDQSGRYASAPVSTSAAMPDRVGDAGVSVWGGPADQSACICRVSCATGLASVRASRDGCADFSRDGGGGGSGDRASARLM